MESERMRLMALEHERLESEKLKNPELFPETTWIDDNTTLETLGIHIPHKEELPEAYLKFLPSDFIVEEITQEGNQTTIDRESLTLDDKPGETVYATLVKCGLSTLEALDELAQLLGVTRDKIQYAGIKDKDAITSQVISIRNTTKEKVLTISSPHFFLKDIHTGKGVLTKGALAGNRFTILLRIPKDIQTSQKIKHTIDALERVKSEGFYNFFYLQRFGTPRLNNYKWAVSILKGNYEKAVHDVISDPGIREIPFFIQKRKEIISLTPHWQEVLQKLEEFPLVFPTEIKMVRYLVKNPRDFAGALAEVEEQVSLWISALASLLYNRKLSAYIMAGVTPPKKLPLFLSTNRNDWLPYSEDLEDTGLFPPNFDTLRRFKTISLNHREIETVDRATITSADIIPEGLIIQFILGKGEYATTFLSHFVNLLSGKAPEAVNENIFDTKQIIKQESNVKTFEYFAALNKHR